MAEKARNELDAIDLLLQDHREVESLFAEFDSLEEGEDEDAEDLVEDACLELEIHDKLETEIFYPAVREAAAGDDDIEDLLGEAEDEHEAVRELIEKLQDLDPDDDARDALFTTLIEQVKHHVEEEESELFPKVKKLEGLDLVELGAEMRERKTELLAEMGVDEQG
jgi:iron-sulfur cluster repair protein YtfE (RIC family)